MCSSNVFLRDRPHDTFGVIHLIQGCVTYVLLLYCYCVADLTTLVASFIAFKARLCTRKMQCLLCPNNACKEWKRLRQPEPHTNFFASSRPANPPAPPRDMALPAATPPHGVHAPAAAPPCFWANFLVSAPPLLLQPPVALAGVEASLHVAFERLLFWLERMLFLARTLSMLFLLLMQCFLCPYNA